MEIYELLKIIKYPASEISKIYINSEGTFNNLLLSRGSSLIRLNSSTDYTKCNYYFLLNKEVPLVQHVPNNEHYTEGYIFNYDEDKKSYVKGKRFVDVAKDLAQMKKINRYSRKVDVVRRLSSDNKELDLNMQRFDCAELELKVKQNDKEYYCHRINDFIRMEYKIYLFINKNGNIGLKEIPYDKYIFKYSEHLSSPDNIYGWLAITGNPMIVVHNVSTLEPKERYDNWYIYNENGNLVKTYPSKKDFMQNINTYKDNCYNGDVNEWVDFSEPVQLYIQVP